MGLVEQLFGRSPATPAAAPEPDRPVDVRDIDLAFRLILGRPADAAGSESYQREADRGLGLQGLIRALLASEEFQRRPAGVIPSVGKPHGSLEGLIRPSDVIGAHSVEELNATSEEYYRRIEDPTTLMGKPFAVWHETPQMLHDLGLLLSGLHIGKTMTVLDFGAGTCWLSRILVQLNCQAICCDVSPSALEIGRRLFRDLPPIGLSVYTPQFLLFDGERIDLPDASVDRIICFDAFHHVPNPETVLAEFARVLKVGGLAGFSEPGKYHSQSPQSQYEMRNHKVLENDIDLDVIFRWATVAGFTDLTVKALADAEIPLFEYDALFTSETAAHEAVKTRVWQRVIDTTASRSIFFLHKGPLALDSRGQAGLGHLMTANTQTAIVAPNETLSLAFSLTNTGDARWLHQNSEIFGVVRLASHLLRANGDLIEIDFSRDSLPQSVDPGETIHMSVDVRLVSPGEFVLVFDLVAEGVTWFENAGSKPVTVSVVVR